MGKNYKKNFLKCPQKFADKNFFADKKIFADNPQIDNFLRIIILNFFY